LSYLAPDIVRALLDGRQPIELTPTRLFRLSKERGNAFEGTRAVLSQLPNGTYQTQPVKRMIQQALLQVLQERWDPTFSEHSYGFRPGHSAHQAVAQAARRYIAEG